MNAKTPLPATHADAEVVRLAIVEDEHLVRDGIVALVSQTPGMECVAAAADHPTAVREAEFNRPDVALLDTSTGDPIGGPRLRLWRERLPRTRLLLFDDLIRDVHVNLVLKSQADGYVTKRDSFAAVAEAIRICAAGQPAFSPALMPRLRETGKGWQLHPPHDEPGLHVLTPRETEVLVYVAQGLTGKQCSELLGISPSTVDNHKARIMRKLKVHKTVELTRLALREGLVPR